MQSHNYSTMWISFGLVARCSSQCNHPHVFAPSDSQSAAVAGSELSEFKKWRGHLFLAFWFLSSWLRHYFKPNQTTSSVGQYIMLFWVRIRQEISSVHQSINSPYAHPPKKTKQTKNKTKQSNRWKIQCNYTSVYILTVPTQRALHTHGWTVQYNGAPDGY